jgi:hypothetical protein
VAEKRLHGKDFRSEMSDPSGGQDLKTPKPPDSAMWLGERKVKKLTSSPTSRKLYFRGGGGITGGPTGPRNSKANTLIHSKFRTDHEYTERKVCTERKVNDKFKLKKYKMRFKQN